MPYIKEKDRDTLDLEHSVSDIIDKLDAPGELNYIITSIIVGYYKNKPIGYTTLNEVIGAVECAKLELYRRVAAPYEDRKKDENGDVYY